MIYILVDNADDSISTMDAAQFDKSVFKDTRRIAGTIDGDVVIVDTGRTCAARLNKWCEQAKDTADLLIALGTTNPSNWTGPAMRNARRQALGVLSGGKVKAADAGINKLMDALAKYIGTGDHCYATMQSEVRAFLRIAEAVTHRPAL